MGGASGTGAPQANYTSVSSGMSMTPTTGTPGAQMTYTAPAASAVPTPGLYIPPPATPQWTIDTPVQTRPKAEAKPTYKSLGYYNTGPSSTGGRGGYAADTWGGNVYKSNKGQYFWDDAGKIPIADSVRQRLIGLK